MSNDLLVDSPVYGENTLLRKLYVWYLCKEYGAKGGGGLVILNL